MLVAGRNTGECAVGSFFEPGMRGESETRSFPASIPFPADARPRQRTHHRLECRNEWGPGGPSCLCPKSLVSTCPLTHCMACQLLDIASPRLWTVHPSSPRPNERPQVLLTSYHLPTISRKAINRAAGLEPRTVPPYQELTIWLMIASDTRTQTHRKP